MSLSSGEKIPVEFITQENRELNLVRRFDVWTIQNGPQRGAVILRFLGFGIVRIVGINPDQARVGDIAVEVSHSGFYTSARVWVSDRWSKGVGMDLKTSGQLLLHFLPCVGSLLTLQKGNAVSQGWGTYGFLDRKCRRTIL